MLAHLKDLVEATDLPVNPDDGNGYGDDHEDVRWCVSTGVSVLSSEDAAGRRADPMTRGPSPLNGVRLHTKRMQTAGCCSWSAPGASPASPWIAIPG